MIYNASAILTSAALFVAIAFAPISEATAVNEDEFTLSGEVHDAESEAPVDMAQVSVAETDFSAETDEQGVFSIEGLPNGDHTLTVEHDNYETYETEFTIDGEDEVISVSLEPRGDDY